MSPAIMLFGRCWTRKHRLKENYWQRHSSECVAHGQSSAAATPNESWIGACAVEPYQRTVFGSVLHSASLHEPLLHDILYLLALKRLVSEEVVDDRRQCRPVILTVE